MNATQCPVSLTENAHSSLMTLLYHSKGVSRVQIPHAVPDYHKSDYCCLHLAHALAIKLTVSVVQVSGRLLLQEKALLRVPDCLMEEKDT